MITGYWVTQIVHAAPTFSFADHLGPIMRSVSEFITSSFGQNHPLTKNDSIVGGKFMNILNGNCRWLRRNNRIVGSRNRCRHHELLEPGRGKYKEIVILGIAGIAELVRDVARGQESIAGLKHK